MIMHMYGHNICMTACKYHILKYLYIFHEGAKTVLLKKLCFSHYSHLSKIYIYLFALEIIRANPTCLNGSLHFY